MKPTMRCCALLAILSMAWAGGSFEGRASGVGSSDRARIRVYCAGPMACAKDFDHMRRVSSELRKAGFQTYLPVDDGFALFPIYAALARSGRPEALQVEARHWMMVAVYTLDMFRLLRYCNATIADVGPGGGGTNPDEGTIMEVSVAAACGRPVAFLKTDEARILPPGAVRGTGWDNPMIVGLTGDFSLWPGYAAATPEELVSKLDAACAAAGPLAERDGALQFATATPDADLPKAIRDAVALGAKVFAVKERFMGRTFDDAMALEQVDAVVALMRKEGTAAGFVYTAQAEPGQLPVDAARPAPAKAAGG